MAQRPTIPACSSVLSLSFLADRFDLPLILLAHRWLAPPLAPPCFCGQWVFYLFGAAAVLWLPLWLPQRVEGPSSGSSGSGKSFNILSLFSISSGVGGDGGSGTSGAATAAVPPSASADSLGDGARLQPLPPQRVMSDAGALLSVTRARGLLLLFVF